MKNRLLEDIGDSQSGAPLPPVRRVQSAAPAAPPQARAVPPLPSPPAAGPRRRTGVWRSRAPRPPAAADAPPPSAAPRVEPTIAPPPAAEAPRVRPGMASFSSREPDWALPLQPEPPPWTERWGRKALGWTAGLMALAALGGTAAWMVQDTRVESTLAVVADHTPPAQPVPPAVLAAVPAAAPAPESGAEPLPPLKLLPPEPVNTASVENPAVAAAAETPAPADAAPAAVPLPPSKPALARARERPRAAAAEQRQRPEAKKPARERVPARAPAEPAKSAPRAPASAQAPDPESPLAETLRLCRAAGYHATACLKRGCEATRFGLVCRG